jgi:hypothetical protein
VFRSMPAMPLRALPCRDQPGLALPAAPCQTPQHPASLERAPPLLACHVAPDHAWADPSMPNLPYQAAPHDAAPRLDSPCLPCRTGPCLDTPGRDRPRHALPVLAEPAEPRLASPRLALTGRTTPCRPCPTKPHPGARRQDKPCLPRLRAPVLRSAHEQRPRATPEGFEYLPLTLPRHSPRTAHPERDRGGADAQCSGEVRAAPSAPSQANLRLSAYEGPCVHGRKLGRAHGRVKDFSANPLTDPPPPAEDPTRGAHRARICR